jgi:hypothetical protein
MSLRLYAWNDDSAWLTTYMGARVVPVSAAYCMPHAQHCVLSFGVELLDPGGGSCR